jgi:membrane protein DedA with SNARE-associated domain
MIDFMNEMNGVIEHHAEWAWLAFALIAFGESTAFIGALIPATPVLLLVGSMLGAGRLDPWDVVPGGIIGAILGYGLSFALGRWAGRRLAHARGLRPHRRSIARVRLFFARYGTPSLIFGRYVLGPFQSLLPFFAGASGMSARRFWTINVFSGVLWIFATLAPGYLAARGAGHVPISSEWQHGATGLLTAISLGAVLACILVALARPLVKLLRASLRG